MACTLGRESKGWRWIDDSTFLTPARTVLFGTELYMGSVGSNLLKDATDQLPGECELRQWSGKNSLDSFHIPQYHGLHQLSDRMASEYVDLVGVI